MINQVPNIPLPARSTLEIDIRVTQPLNITLFPARQRVTPYVMFDLSNQLGDDTPKLMVGERIGWSLPVVFTLPGKGCSVQMRPSRSAFEVYLRPSRLGELRTILAENQPVIVFLKTGSLGYWSMDTADTTEVIGLDSAPVALRDPYFAAAPRTTSLRCVEKAWAKTGQFAALIRPRQKP